MAGLDPYNDSISHVSLTVSDTLQGMQPSLAATSTQRDLADAVSVEPSEPMMRLNVLKGALFPGTIGIGNQAGAIEADEASAHISEGGMSFTSKPQTASAGISDDSLALAQQEGNAISSPEGARSASACSGCRKDV